MTDGGAEQAVVVSAVVVSGVYFYRKLTDVSGAVTSGGGAAGSGGRAVGALFGQRGQQVAPLGRWMLGFGVTFMVISVLASVSAPLGAALAVLVATGSVLTNGLALADDVTRKTA